jgi:hypothetical protein
LELDITKAHDDFAWRDRFPRDRTVYVTVAWYLAWRQGQDMPARSLAVIDDFMSAQGAIVSALQLARRPHE